MTTEGRRPLILRGARVLADGEASAPRDVVVRGEQVVAEPRPDAALEIDLDGCVLLPALVNAHDVLDLAVLPPLGARAPYASVYDWTHDCEAELGGHAAALAIPQVDRLFLGGVRNLLAGVASVLHQHPDHRSLARGDFPVRVQRRYAFAHSPGLTPALRRTYRTSDRRIPWITRAAEGSDPRLRGELEALVQANVLRQNTVIARGTALEAADAAQLARARAALAWSPECDWRQYGRTPPAAALARGGVQVGVGSDAAPAGARDLLSTLAVARAEARLTPREALDWGSRGSAAVARMPLGDCAPGGTADLLATSSPERLAGGDRRAIELLVVRGRAVYGSQRAMSAVAGSVVLHVDGQPRVLEPVTGRRLVSLLRRHPVLRQAVWLASVSV